MKDNDNPATPCNEATGAGCGGGTGDYNASPLQNGDAVTNPGAIEN